MPDVTTQPSPQTELTESQLADLRTQADENLYFFQKGILGFDRLNPRIHMPICEQLEQYKTQTRQGILLPRGWYKSTICSIGYPIWRAVKDPDNFTSLLVQNSFTNAEQKLRKIAGIFEDNQLFRAIYPDLMPDKKCTWKSSSLEVKRKNRTAEGTFDAAGARTQVTSRHYNLITEDDTVAPELSELGEDNLCPTKDDIQTAIGWHRLAMPLLVDPSKDQILVVGTRWFEKDLISWIQDNEKHYKWYSRAVRENADGLPDEEGEITFPERFGKQTLEELYAGLGPYMFSCLYMNKPVRSGDMLFQTDWFKFYEEPGAHLITFTTVDIAGDPNERKSKSDADWSVVITCGKDLFSGQIYVLDYWRKKCHPSELISQIFEHHRRYKPQKVGVEAVALQSMLISFVKERMQKEKTWFICEPITHNKRSKAARIQGLQPYIAAGKVVFRAHHKDLINELLVFPLGSHDDLADALAMQLTFWPLTKSVVERQLNKALDPNSMESAIAELRGRARRPNSGLAYDVFDPTGEKLLRRYVESNSMN